MSFIFRMCHDGWSFNHLSLQCGVRCGTESPSRRCFLSLESKPCVSKSTGDPERRDRLRSTLEPFRLSAQDECKYQNLHCGRCRKHGTKRSFQRWLLEVRFQRVHARRSCFSIVSRAQDLEQGHLTYKPHVQFSIVISE